MEMYLLDVSTQTFSRCSLANQCQGAAFRAGKCISVDFMDPLCYFHLKPLCSLAKCNETVRLKLMRPRESWRSSLEDFFSALPGSLKRLLFFKKGLMC